MSSKKFVVTGGALLVVPIVLLVVGRLLDCTGGEYLFLQNFLVWVHGILSRDMPLIGAFFTLLGLITFLWGFIRWKMAHGAKKSAVIFGSFFLLLLAFFVSSFWLAAFNCARCKGEDAAVKATLAQIRAQAELYHDQHTNYKGLCDSAEIVQMLQNIQSIQLVKEKKALLCSVKVNELTCTDQNDQYAVSAKLPLAATLNASYFCVDNTGFQNVTDRLVTWTRCQ